MNPWPVYNFIKNHVLQTNRFPTVQEIRRAIPGASFMEIREGIIEAKIQYEREWKHYSSEVRKTRSRKKYDALSEVKP